MRTFTTATPCEEAYRTVHLDRMDYQARVTTDSRERQTIMERGQRQRWEDHVTLQLVDTLRLHVYGRNHPQKHVIRYPETWLDAVKERFAPAWLLDLWPARFVTISVSLEEAYPDFEPTMGGYPPVLKVTLHKKHETPIW